MCTIRLADVVTPLFVVLGALFVILKLVSVVSWPWWAVFMPLYLPPAFLIIFHLGMALLLKIHEWIGKIFRHMK